MEKQEVTELIKELIREPEICSECGEGVFEYFIGDTGYTIKKCSKCGYSLSEE